MDEDYSLVNPRLLKAAPTTSGKRPYAKLIGFINYPNENSGVLYITTRDNSTIAYHDVPQDMWEELKTAKSTYAYLQESGLWGYPYEYVEIDGLVNPAMLRYRRQKLLGKENYASTFGKNAEGVSKDIRRIGTPRYTKSDSTRYTR